MYKAILEVGGKVYSLSSVNVNAYNRGSGYDPHPGDHTLQLQIRSPKMDQFMWDWINNNEVQKLNGTVKIVDTDNDRVIQYIRFEQGYCSQFNMNFYLANDYNSETSITVAAAKITVDASDRMVQAGPVKDH